MLQNIQDVFFPYMPEEISTKRLKQKNPGQKWEVFVHPRNLALGFAFIPASVGAFVVLERETGSKHLQVSWRHWGWSEKDD